MIRLVVDSTSEITPEEGEKLGITVIPMKLLIDEEEYRTGVDLTTDEFYQKLENCQRLPQTTQINQAEYMDVIKPLLDNGDEVFVMSISSGLSGTFDSLTAAKAELGTDKLEIFDSETVTIPFYALALEAKKLIDSGVTLKELKEKMESLKKRIKIYAVIDNVKYLIKGGRLSKVAGVAVTALNIKPIVTIEDKVLKVVGKAVGFPMALKMLCKKVNNLDKSLPVYFGYSCDRSKCDNFKEVADKMLKIESEKLLNVGPIIGTHVGPGCVAIVYFSGIN